MRKNWFVLLLLVLIPLLMIGCGMFDNDDDDDDNQNTPEPEVESLLPVLFVHGGAGSASQFESQAQRFIANGYPLDHLAAFEYGTGDMGGVITDLGKAETSAILNRLDAAVDDLLAQTGADQINLIGHSLGTLVSQSYLGIPDYAAKIANYVNVDGRTADALPGGVPTLALWARGAEYPEEDTRKIVGAVNDYDPMQSHIQSCTSDISFVKIYDFFNGQAPDTSEIPVSEEEQVTIAGKVNIFPDNVGAQGYSLEIYQVDADTGFRTGVDPVSTWSIDSEGDWGPVLVTKGAFYEFALSYGDVQGARHSIYREPFLADSYFIRLNTSMPGEGLSSALPRSDNHTNMMIGRDKEFWGDQGEDNDILMVVDSTGASTSVATAEAAAFSNRLSALFLFDAGPNLNADPPETPLLAPNPESDGVTTLSPPDPYFHDVPFISGLDLYIPAAEDELETISVQLTPRGGGAVQTINVPNWSSTEVRSISVQFRDYARPLLPVLFVHGTSGSASQFESQAQRFMANGYPLEYLAAFEYDSSIFSAAASDQAAFAALLYDPAFQAGINAKIDQLLADTGAEKVNLIGHSLGTFVCNAFLKTGDNAQRIAHYVSVDGTTGYGTGTPFGGVNTLALWSMQNPDTSALGETAIDDHNDAQSHIEVCTSAISFGKMYAFFNNETAVTTDIPEAKSNTVWIAGRANIFPENVGADATSLSIYEVDRSTGFQVEDADPIVEDLDIDSTGNWGPFEIKKGQAYEFVLTNETEPTDEQRFYREPFYANDYFIRLNTGRTGEGIVSHLNRDGAHTLLMIARDKEMWGDVVDSNDLLYINDDDVSVLTPGAAAQERRLSSLFLCDQDGEQDSDYTTIEDDNVTMTSFIAGIDYYIPAATQPDLSDLSTISIKLFPRGSEGISQIINVPNWPSDRVRTVSVQFRDFVQ